MHRGQRTPCPVPSQGASTHGSLALRWETTMISPVISGTHILLLLSSPSTAHPQTPPGCPGAEPWVAPRRSQQDPHTQPLHPNLGAALGPRCPQAAAMGQEPNREAGGTGRSVLRLPRDDRHSRSPRTLPAAPPWRGCTPGVQVGDQSTLRSPMPRLVPLPPLEHVAIYHLAQLLYLADQN